MNEEEYKAIEYTENCLMKITLGIDCEFDVNILDTLLNIIKKSQKENEELKNKLSLKQFDVNIVYNDYLEKLNEYERNTIQIQRIKDKIEEEKLPLTIVGGRKNKKTLEYGIKLGKRQALQELLEGGQS